MNANGYGLYRDPARGVLGGVCAGIARYFGVEIWVIRVIAVVLLLFSMPISVLLYLVAWLFLDKRSDQSFENPGGYGSSPSGHGGTPKERLQRIEDQLDALEPRVQRLEQELTSEAFNLHRKFRDL
ncbi:envelope stress response membrane protein PspC [Dongshaea marina]|uniref:envelope stress response membrane protein PspC n=1 Tax=Dongshaea marina TaxID=2047966 RepID=UPI00131EFEF4|nr:envelope stress response membrane protein PspC [Dongshaea marina]